MKKVFSFLLLSLALINPTWTMAEDITNSSSQVPIAAQLGVSTLGIKSDKSDPWDVIAAIVILFIVIIFVGTYLAAKKEHRFHDEFKKYRSQYSLFKGRTLNAAPSDLPPALVNLLYDENSISTDVIAATLFYLSKKGYYTLETRSSLKQGLLKSHQEEELFFIKNMKEEPAYSHLRYFIDRLSRYEENGSFTLSSIQENLNTEPGNLEVQNWFKKWTETIEQDARDLGFYTQIAGKEVLSNKFYDEKLKWQAYKEYVLMHIDDENNTVPIVNVDDALNYGRVLGIDINRLEIFIEKLIDISCNIENSIQRYPMCHYYPFFIINLHMWEDITQALEVSTVHLEA